MAEPIIRSIGVIEEIAKSLGEGLLKQLAEQLVYIMRENEKITEAAVNIVAQSGADNGGYSFGPLAYKKLIECCPKAYEMHENKIRNIYG